MTRPFRVADGVLETRPRTTYAALRVSPQSPTLGLTHLSL